MWGKVVNGANLIPPQYKGAAILVCAIALVGIGFGTGWKVNGWRLGSDISDLQNDLRTCQGNVATYADAVKAQNQSITDARKQAESRQKAAQEALERAREANASLQDQIRSLRRAEGKTCQDGIELLNRELGL